MLGSMRVPPAAPLSQLFPSAPPLALDLMAKCLRFNPDKRITADEALRHPYIAEFACEADYQPLSVRPVRICIDDDVKVGGGVGGCSRITFELKDEGPGRPLVVITLKLWS